MSPPPRRVYPNEEEIRLDRKIKSNQIKESKSNRFDHQTNKVDRIRTCSFVVSSGARPDASRRPPRIHSRRCKNINMPKCWAVVVAVVAAAATASSSGCNCLLLGRQILSSATVAAVVDRDHYHKRV